MPGMAVASVRSSERLHAARVPLFANEDDEVPIRRQRHDRARRTNRRDRSGEVIGGRDAVCSCVTEASRPLDRGISHRVLRLPPTWQVPTAIPLPS